jgi:hypothetical protein
MATKKTTRRRQPFVIEPLDWVAPDAQREEPEKDSNDRKETSSKQKAEG